MRSTSVLAYSFTSRIHYLLLLFNGESIGSSLHVSRARLLGLAAPGLGGTRVELLRDGEEGSKPGGPELRRLWVLARWQGSAKGSFTSVGPAGEVLGPDRPGVRAQSAWGSSHGSPTSIWGPFLKANTVQKPHKLLVVCKYIFYLRQLLQCIRRNLYLN